MAVPAPAGSLGATNPATAEAGTQCTLMAACVTTQGLTTTTNRSNAHQAPSQQLDLFAESEATESSAVSMRRRSCSTPGSEAISPSWPHWKFSTVSPAWPRPDQIAVDVAKLTGCDDVVVAVDQLVAAVIPRQQIAAPDPPQPKQLNEQRDDAGFQKPCNPVRSSAVGVVLVAALSHAGQRTRRDALNVLGMNVHLAACCCLCAPMYA